MTTGLNPSGVINVTYEFNAATALANNTSSLLILGPTAVPTAIYTSLSAIAAVYGTTAPEYLASANYFSYAPQPQEVQIAQWYNVASPAYLYGGALTPSQQTLSNFTTITNGGINFTINGTAQNLTGLNFDAVTNLNGVASAINTALTGATVTWNGSNFTVTTTATGAGTAATGTVTFAGQPANNDTLTINGQVLTFVTTVTTPTTQVLIGTNTAATAANLLYLLNSSAIAALTALSYSLVGTVLTITDRTVGTAGNSITLAKSSTNITVSGATLTGGVQPATIAYATTGAGEDISTLLGLTAALAQAPVPGNAAESAVNAVVRLDNASQYFFAVTFAAPTLAESDVLAIAGYIEGTNHVFFASTQATNNFVAGTGIGSQLAAAGYRRTCITYNGSTPYAGAALAAIPLTVNYDQANSANTVMFKTLNGVTADTLTQAQANGLTANRVNYFVNYDDGVAIIQNGVMSGPAYIDEIVGITAVIFDLQAAEFNVLLNFPKVDQTDAGMDVLNAADKAVFDKYVAANFLGSGVWNGTPFGALQTGQTIPGYYIYRAPIATQSVQSRALRQAVPAQHALKLAGAVQSSSILLNVNR